MHGSIHLFDRLPQVDALPRPAPRAANDRTVSPVRSKPLVGLIRNDRSHRNMAQAHGDRHDDNIVLATPRRRSELADILSDFAQRGVDCIAIDGGDGTVRDVLTCGAGVFGESWPPLIVLPHGKTNALAIDLGIPSDWTLDDALVAMQRTVPARRQPLVVRQRGNARAQVHGFVLGAGAYNRAINLGQRSHDLGAFDSAVVFITALWSVAQAVLGRSGNPWREGTRMRLRGPTGKDLPHRGGLPEDERYMLFATTLGSLPAGLNPFRGISQVLKVAVLDSARRGLLLRLGSILRGRAGEKTRAMGYHAFGEEALDMEIGDAFIIDGEAFPAGRYRISAGPKLRFVVP
ncbi:diacylglycerol/lipid kinase family protein [Aurantiacibacter poecillastricola]|uniref:diacylglycerol/lipid kinase family protein n=1 Tax=Aurantiacibacter poecillastricola TaxID=3064385 RepID=UPI00273D786F|nr:diacylglycerol kinase family protein [Aurantiacibacter sp. 219JJ12-13]MDP5260628.1 diacylglycerol kinase family protein [Aurantiacibacter sp. 219JJ12-13]